MIDKLVVKLLVLKMWLSDDHGQDVMEYAIITGVVAVALIAALLIFTTAFTKFFTDLGAWMDTHLIP